MLLGNVPRKNEVKIANSMQSINIYVLNCIILPWDFNLNNVCLLFLFFFFRKTLSLGREYDELSFTNITNYSKVFVINNWLTIADWRGGLPSNANRLTTIQ